MNMAATGSRRLHNRILEAEADVTKASENKAHSLPENAVSDFPRLVCPSSQQVPWNFLVGG